MSETKQNSKKRLIRRQAVEDRTGLGKSSIYALIKSGKFPPPVKLSARAVAWDDGEEVTQE